MAMSVSRRPFRARRGPGRHLGFRRSGSTLGYNPTAASRLPSPRLRISTTLTLVACALCMAAVPAAAQSITGAIVGRVTDPSDAVIVDANVRAINAATGAVDAAATDNTGFYRIANLLPGEYLVEVAASGFQTARVSAQRLSVGDNLRLDVKLELGETEFSITIEDRASEVNAEDAQLGKVMRDIARLPVLSTANGRSVLELAYTQPGTVPVEFLVRRHRRRDAHGGAQPAFPPRGLGGELRAGGRAFRQLRSQCLARSRLRRLAAGRVQAHGDHRTSEPGVPCRVLQSVQSGAVHQSHRRHRQHEFRENPRDRRPAHHSVHVAVHVLRAGRDVEPLRLTDEPAARTAQIPARQGSGPQASACGSVRLCSASQAWTPNRLKAFTRPASANSLRANELPEQADLIR